MEQKSGSLPEKTPFETLIKGPYREDFQKKVEEILRKRFRQPGKIPAGRGGARREGAPRRRRARPPGSGPRRRRARPRRGGWPFPRPAQGPGGGADGDGGGAGPCGGGRPRGREQAPPEDGKQALRRR